MKLIFTSNTKHYHKENNIRVSNELDNTNNLVDYLKDNIYNYDNILFIASDPSDYKKTDSYSKLFFEGLSHSGINFKNYLILDDRTISNAKEYINTSDIIFLTGGDTFVQSEFFKKINLKKLLKDYSNIIVGQSAGSINLAKYVYNSPEEGYENSPIYFEGLGLSNINIEPHFILNEINFNEVEINQRKHILNESQKRIIYGLCDGSHIIETSDTITFYGETYIIKDQKINLLCKDKEIYVIKKVSVE